MKRREFVTLIGGATAWPIAARAQRSGAVRRIAVVGALAADDVETVKRSTVFEQALAAAGWTKDGTIAIDYHWVGNDPALAQKMAVELVAHAPDVLLASSNLVIAPLSKATRTIPIVMVQVIDPVGSGYVESMARPGGNITGFTQFEYSLAGKWLDLLMEIAPRTSRVAVLRDPTRSPGIAQFARDPGDGPRTRGGAHSDRSFRHCRHGAPDNGVRERSQRRNDRDGKRHRHAPRGNHCHS